MGKVEIVAELSCNHGGSLDRALALVDAAADAGADTVKLQHDPPDGGLTLDCDQPEFTVHGGPWDGRRMADLYRETYTPWEWTDAIAARAKERGLRWLSTPGSVEAVAFLEAHGCERYKVGSFDITDHELLAAIAKTRKPAIVSTGCAAPDDLTHVVYTMPGVTLLHCVSRYPTPEREASLNAMVWLGRDYRVRVGLSDHSIGWFVPVLAVAAGASIIEKHLTLGGGGPDAEFSSGPDEFASMVREVRAAEEAMTDRHHAAPRQFVKSLYVVADVKAGEMFTRDNVRAIRPGHGLHPRDLHTVLGSRAARDVKRGEPVDWGVMA